MAWIFIPAIVALRFHIPDNLTNMNGTDDPANPYRNPRATAYFTIGAAGNKEMHPGEHPNCTVGDGAGRVCAPPSGTGYNAGGKPAPWAACTAGDPQSNECVDFNFAKIHVANDTHLRWQQVSATEGGRVIDDVWLIQEKHGSFAARAQQLRQRAMANESVVGPQGEVRRNGVLPPWSSW